MELNKLVADRLTEEQMQKVRNYLAQMPNKSHQGDKGVYGGYVKVTADVRASVDRHTAVTSTPWYENVTFEIQDVGTKCEYTAKRMAERKEAIKGLASLIGELLTEQ